MRRLKAILTAIGAVLTLVGAAGFFLPFILAAAFRDDNTIELPLAEVKDVAVSPNGDVYFALMHAGRVQRYAGDGRFVSSFPVNSAGGIFCIVIVDGALQVHVARRDATDAHDLDGRLLRENFGEDSGIEYIPCKRDPQVASISSSWRSLQVRFTDDRPPLTIQRLTWHFLALHPFQSWLTFAVGLLLMAWWREGVFRSMGFGRSGS
jgi:hypothetical protein